MTRTTANHRRPGISLIEVLVAIFVMAIGLMALLTLFPLGALNMAQAIKDDRTGTAAANAAGLARTLWKAAVEANPNDPDNGSQNGGITIAMLYPNDYVGSPNPPLLASRTDNGLDTGNVLDSPSYPVYIDPFGYLKYPGPNWQRWLAGQPPGATNPPGSIPRCVLNSLNGASNAQILSLFSSQDDLNLGNNGLPQSPVQREQRYSWAYLVRRPSARQPRNLDLTVIVYSGRSLQFTADLVPSGETMYQADFGDNGANIATLYWSANQEPPALRPGRWILDATMADPTVPQPNTNFTPRGYFYRVVSVTPTGTNAAGLNQMDVELQTPVRTSPPATWKANSGNCRAVILDNVVEVFEKAELVP
jgi:hypothetical protein